MKEYKKRERLINYIGQINNRNINKRMTSGFTWWGIIVALSYISYDLFSSLPFILNNFYNITHLFTLIYNSFIIVYLGCNFLSIFLISSVKRGLFPKLIAKQIIPINIILFFIFLLGTFLNIFFFIVNTSISNMFFALSTILLILVFYKLFKNKNNLLKKDYPSLEWVHMNNDIKSTMLKHSFILFFIPLIFYYFNIRSILAINFWINNMKSIKISFYIWIVVFLIITLAFKLSKSIKYKWLENFEIKIILENYRYEKIKKEFIKEYVGDTVQNWLEKTEKQIDLEKDKLENMIKKYKNNYLEIKNYDNKKELKDNYNKKINKFKTIFYSYNIFRHFLMEKVDLFKEFTSQGPFSDKEENKINNIKNKWSNYIIDFRNFIEDEIQTIKSDRKYINKELSDKEDILDIEFLNNHDFI